MTQKQALKQLEAYCKANKLILISGAINIPTYAIAAPDEPDKYKGIRTINIDSKYYIKLSGFYKPTDLLIWIEGYISGLQQNL